MIVTRKQAELLMRHPDFKPKECICEPCPDCGYKHYCNLMIEHAHRVRSGECPAK